ncbi:MAG: cold-shock protein [Desulfobacterales bacterium]|jgi:CspA family cold shock protein|nr:cold-shock protein [Desulfobacterales bacterium]
MPTGTVKWFNSSQGYGFIEEEHGRANVFVQLSEVIPSRSKGFRPLKEGDRVAFDIERGHTGLTAINVMLHRESHN